MIFNYFFGVDLNSVRVNSVRVSTDVLMNILILCSFEQNCCKKKSPEGLSYYGILTKLSSVNSKN